MAAQAATGAGTIAIALASEFQSMDPHRAATPADETVASHVFETLVDIGPDFGARPRLAIAWTQTRPDTWQLQLRRDVRFHDGTLLGADDVAASIRRAIRLKPSVVVGGKPEWLDVDVVDRHTIRLRAEPGYVFAWHALARIRIASAASLKALDAPGSAAAAPVGTGPYRLRSAQPQRIDLVAHGKPGGKPPPWETVEFHAMPDDEKRLAAAREHRIDVVERAPLDQAESLRSDGHFALRQAPTGRLMYLQFGTHASDSPYVVLPTAERPARNPLLDRRVRRAISLAIDRAELVRTVLHGVGEPAGQLVPAGYLGHVRTLQPDPRDLSDARALLTEAGFPDGFSMTLHGPLNVYPADVAALAAVARMLDDVGIKARAVSEAAATFAGRGQRQQYSGYMRGYAGSLADASEPLVTLLATHDANAGAGRLNWARYSNGTLDSMLQRAVTQQRADARDLMLQEATRLAMNDVALVPLYFAHELWLARRDIRFAPDPGAGPLALRLTPSQRVAPPAGRTPGRSVGGAATDRQAR